MKFHEGEQKKEQLGSEDKRSKVFWFFSLISLSIQIKSQIGNEVI